MPPSGKKLVLLLVVLCLIGVACAAFYNRYFSAAGGKPVTARQATGEDIDLTRPAMLIRSSSLAKLPRDLLRLPVAKDVLTEDIVNYYEHHDGKLALSGTVRRIAYENKLKLPDRLVEMALDAPAEVALWSDGRGRLRYFAVAMEQNVVARTITLLLPLHSKVLARQSWPEIQADSLLFSYGNEKIYLFTRGNRVVALSSDLLTAKTGETDNAENSGDVEKPRDGVIGIVGKLLAGKTEGPSFFAQSFHLLDEAPAKGHEIVVATQALAFGYEYFMPGLAAFRLVFDGSGAWQSDVLVNEEAATAAYTPLWRSLPHGAAFCAALPVDWTALAEAAKLWRQDSGNSDNGQLDDLLSKFGPAAACWYGDSGLYAPLFAAASDKKLTEPEKETLLRLSQAATKVKQADDSVAGPDGGMWRGSIPSAHGIAAPGTEKTKKRFFYPAAAVWAFTAGQKEAEDIALFSPNAALVSKALEVAAKKFPTIADSAAFPEKERIIAFIDPAALSELLRKEIFQAAPEGESENFLNTVDFLFTPRLKALAAYPPQVVSFHSEKGFFIRAAPDWQWYPLRWDSLGSGKTENAAANAATEAIQP